MFKIGHYVLTYNGISWIVALLEDNADFPPYVYTWAHTADDAVTQRGRFRQPVPHFGYGVTARRLSLGLATLWERAFKGMTCSTIAAMSRDGISLVHAHFGRAGYYALPIVEQLDVPLITSFYGYDISEYPARYPIWREHYLELFKARGCILCLGARMRQNLLDLGCPPDKLRIHHLGVDVQQLHYQPRHWSPDEPLRVLFASDFRERKGIPYALEALGAFQHEVKLEITIIGEAPDHPDGAREQKKIMQTLAAQNLLPITRLMGRQPYSVMLEEAYQHHIFMAPSVTASDGDMEGTPMALVDMAATGMPIISTTHSDIPEIIRHGETGFLAEERDSAGLLEYLRWYAGHPDQWERITLAGRQHVETEFDRGKQNERLRAIYRQTLA